MDDCWHQSLFIKEPHSKRLQPFRRCGYLKIEVVESQKLCRRATGESSHYTSVESDAQVDYVVLAAHRCMMDAVRGADGLRFSVETGYLL